MDLIYANENFEDIGVIQNFTMDLAYGYDENDFEIKMALQTPQCKAGYYVYVEGTEYGGRIEEIGADTDANILIYRGRTWQGILQNKIIEPTWPEAYYLPDLPAEANDVVADIIERCDLDDVFKVLDEDSGITIYSIDNYNQGFRYSDVNSSLFDMLYNNNAKLIIRVEGGFVTLHVEPNKNYALEEFDSSQKHLRIVQKFAHCNHLICLGQGEMSNRAVLHLFTDEGGRVLQHLRTETPIKDTDYITDLRKANPATYPDVNEIQTGKYEYAEVYDYKDAPITENYEELTTKPANWDYNYWLYYEKTEGEDGEQGDAEAGDNYSQIERNIQDIYVLTDEKPSGWNKGYDQYYTRQWDAEEGEYTYTQVESQYSPTYTVLTQEPNNWKKKFANYYYDDNGTWKSVEKYAVYVKVDEKPSDWKKNYGNYYTTDGVNYNSISGGSINVAYPTTTKPSHWATDWKDYYIKDKNGIYRKISDTDLSKRSTAPKWQKNTYYIVESETVTPSFANQGQVYAKKMRVPQWRANTYYRKDDEKVVIPWQANTYYYQDTDVDVGVEFVPGCYYKKWEDRYAELLAGGLDQLTQMYDNDEIDVNLSENELIYDIGDIVGGHEEITDVQTQQPVTKKIVKIENGLATITYESR